jgi:exodeoxyribonuclease VII large subunit
MNNELPPLSVSDFVALTNQALEHVFPSVVISGELSNFRVSKNKWVYFDLKDDEASVRFFGTVYMLPGPLEDGMMLEVRGAPRLHPNFGFSVTVQSMRPTGEGTIRKAAQLLEAKLMAEGLFAPERKRPLPYPPTRIGLVTSGESAAYADFIKILAARWQGVDIELADVQVQGERSPAQLVAAIQWFNEQSDPPDILVVIRGGGSADDLQAFSAESVVRAVAASRIPTLVAIGHEIDVSLAELAADQAASTPSNAAELLVPDRREALVRLAATRERLADNVEIIFDDTRQRLFDWAEACAEYAARIFERHESSIQSRKQLVAALNPALALARGFAIVRGPDGKALRDGSQFTKGAIVDITVSDAVASATITEVKLI